MPSNLPLVIMDRDAHISLALYSKLSKRTMREIVSEATREYLIPRLKKLPKEGLRDMAKDLEKAQKP